MEKFKGKYRIPSNRLQGYDYGAHGFYFVTICTKYRIHYFGEIVGGSAGTDNRPSGPAGTDKRPSGYAGMDKRPSGSVETDNCPSLRATIMGQTAIHFWNDIPNHYPFVELDEFVVMPDHIHGILFFNRPGKTDWQPNQFAGQTQNLGAVIRSFKSTVKRFANQNKIAFEWQPLYHDRIVRDDNELFAIRRYIINNPAKWYRKMMG